ncbi:hypothetical protein SAMN02745883_00794 [Caminicella sporogenes DSM 14501]|uniref:Twitching motility protein PilT n=1 Tax=Caminicella sporogenes DSM 14501 TaxID=1121266 RepID=A0A1M6N4L3_9FIRM|nr:hypothetical protein [Caminicella sporogenes]RKD22366.1 hypothetical protein BET04_04850 [Caminicella sporogenes]WIF95182.1 hypothetical protein QNI18_00650 [Caminicella sporogenes]SHJ90592.1 hypothetical protein SAMN02745883_00794 [Caminicella sporogenes DSM 14501]
MISIIAGPKGSGKTKKLINMANKDVESSKGNVIFVDDDKRHMYDLRHDLRFISMDEYPLKNADEFFGFLCGILSNDYDINKIYIDGLFKVMQANHDDIPKFIDKLKSISESYNIDFIMTISCTKNELNEDMHQYLI